METQAKGLLNSAAVTVALLWLQLNVENLRDGSLPSS
jgi:hypothetical protein